MTAGVRRSTPSPSPAITTCKLTALQSVTAATVTEDGVKNAENMSSVKIILPALAMFKIVMVNLLAAIGTKFTAVVRHFAGEH